MTEPFPDTGATSRTELCCPSCLTTGLEAAGIGKQQYTSETAWLCHATVCPNEDCAVARVSPEAIESQLASKPRRLLSRWLGKRIVVQLLAVALALSLLAGAGIAASGFVDSGGSHLTTNESTTASPTAPPTSTGDERITVHDAQGNWTIYATNGVFTVSGQVEGSIVFLTANGTATPQFHSFQTLAGARDAVLAWFAHHRQAPAEYTAPNATQSLNATGWQVVPVDDQLVVAGKVNETLTYLYPNASRASIPYRYANRSMARQAILAWLSHRAAAPTQYPRVTPVSNASVRDALGGRASSAWAGSALDRSIAPQSTSVSRTTDQTVSGHVYDSDGEPVAGAVVHLHSNPRTTRTGPNGTYQFRNVSTGTHEIYVEPAANSSLGVSPPTEFTLAANGSLQVTNSSEYATYLPTAAGDVAGNRLQLLTHERQPIRVQGQGSNVVTTLQYAQPRNAHNTTITLTNVTTGSRQTATLSGTNVTRTISVRGGAAPRNQTLTVKALPRTQGVTTTGAVGSTNSTFDPTIRGNRAPRNATLTLRGQTQTTHNSTTGRVQWDEQRLRTDIRQSKVGVSSDDSWNRNTRTVLTAGANGTYQIVVSWRMLLYDGAFGTLTVDACSEAGCRAVASVSKSGDFPSGRIEQSVTLTRGETLELTTSISGDYGSVQVEDSSRVTYQGGENPARTVAITPNGTLPPTNATLQVRAPKQPTVNAWDTEADRTHATISFSGGSEHEEGTSVLFTAPRAGTYRLAIPYDVYAWNADPFSGYASMEIAVDDGPQLLYKTARADDTGGERHRGRLVTTVDLERGQQIVKRYDMYGPADADVLANDDGIERIGSAPGRVQIQVGGHTYTTEPLSLGERTTVNLGNLSRSPRIRVKATATNGTARVLDYRLDWTERTGARGIRVHTAGQQQCVHTGRLNGTVDCSVSGSALNGTQDEVNVSVAAGRVNYSLSYTARAVPKEVQAKIGGQAMQLPAPAARKSSMAGTTVSVSGLTQGQNRITVTSMPVDGIPTATVATLRYEGAIRQTRKPVVVVTNANGTSHRKAVPDHALDPTGRLQEQVTLAIPSAWLSPGHNRVRVYTPGGSQVRVQLRSQGLVYQSEQFVPTANATR